MDDCCCCCSIPHVASEPAMLQSNCPELTLLARGKVRDLYQVDAETLLFVATDRISAFDVVMKNGVPGKGRVLTAVSQFWFEFLGTDVLPHHLVTTEMAQMPQIVQQYRAQLEGRSMLVKRLAILPVEAIVRGYLVGTLSLEYKTHGTMAGVPAPPGLPDGTKLPAPLFTPSTKASKPNEHDEPITVKQLGSLVGAEVAASIEKAALELYRKAATHAESCGLILADTKFEFGLDANGVLHLADEALTPDSSRYWAAAGPGTSVHPSLAFDKQHVRDYLRVYHPLLDQNGAELPDSIIVETQKRYAHTLELLTTCGNPIAKK